MVTALVDGQFGSCGKGLIAGYLASSYRVHVRVGAANAGHTLYVDGEKHVCQQLPVAAYGNPYARLVLGAGAMLSPEILKREIDRNVAWRKARGCPPILLYIDQRAHVVLPEHIEQEQRSDLAARIGSTSTLAREGIGAAEAARVMRTGYRTASEAGYTVCDTVELLQDALCFDMGVLLEGTQGTGLDNVLGLYPYVTSRRVTAAGLAADAGIGPMQIDRVLMVVRTYPIRVAGNSGPFWEGSSELDWAQLGVPEDNERTTVTRKIRRVASFSYEQVKYAARVNSATEIALTFCDYLAPEIRDRTGIVGADEADGFDYVGPMIRRIEAVTGVPVTYLGTSPEAVLEREPDIEPVVRAA